MSDSSDSPTPRRTAATSVQEPEPAHADSASDTGFKPYEPAAITESNPVAPAVAGFQPHPVPAAAGPQPAPAASPAPARRGLRELPHYTLGEEIFNSVTHGIGVLLAIAALVLLIVKAALGGGGATHIASAIVFGISMILEYLASTLYHAIAHKGAKRVFRTIDHSCIYLLIAGSYTPFLLIPLAPYGGIPMFALIWVLAIAGISFEIVGRERQPRWVTTLIYLVMGWLVVFRLPQLIAALDPVCLGLLVAGGLCYTVGTAFYLMKRIRYMHSIWHLWVLAGSVFLFMAVILFVI